MFNFSNNRRGQIREHLSGFQDDYNKEQKAAIMWALILLANSDGNIHPTEAKSLDETALMLDISPEDPIMNRIMAGGKDEIIRILNTLERTQKEWFITALHGMIHADGKVEDIEIGYALGFAEDIGISQNEYKQIIEKVNLLMKLYLDK